MHMRTHIQANDNFNCVSVLYTYIYIVSSIPFISKNAFYDSGAFLQFYSIEHFTIKSDRFTLGQ